MVPEVTDEETADAQDMGTWGHIRIRSGLVGCGGSGLRRATANRDSQRISVPITVVDGQTSNSHPTANCRGDSHAHVDSHSHAANTHTASNVHACSHRCADSDAHA